jgi:hypothetical protein
MSAPEADEAELRKRLFELESAMDTIRSDTESVSEPAALAEERDRIWACLEALLPPGELGHQDRQQRPVGPGVAFDPASYARIHGRSGQS